jgi:hypothetical protein
MPERRTLGTALAVGELVPASRGWSLVVVGQRLAGSPKASSEKAEVTDAEEVFG